MFDSILNPLINTPIRSIFFITCATAAFQFSNDPSVLVEVEIIIYTVVQLVSAVGGGKLSQELDLEELSENIRAFQVRYEPLKYHGIIVRFSEDGPAVLIYSSGSFSISGASSLQELWRNFEKFESKMEDILGSLEYEISFEVRNLVHVTEIPTESAGESINLNYLMMGLGVENVEYEPEQFPGLMYRPSDMPGLYLIFASGSLVSTGHSDPDLTMDYIKKVKERVRELLEEE